MPEYLYVTISEIKERLNLENNDQDRAWLDVARSASRWVDDLTGHRFYATSDSDPNNPVPPTEVRYYSQDPSCDVLSLEIDDFLSLTEVVTDANGDGTYEYTWATPTDYWLEPKNAPSKGRPYTTIHKASYGGRYWFPTYPNSVKVTGNFGYCTLANLPPQIKTLAGLIAEMMGRSMLELNLPGVNSYQVGPDLRVTMSKDELPLMARKIIDLYRVPLFVV